MSDNNKEKPVISVIVPVYNVERYLERCLKSLFAQDVKVPYEVIVVDDGSKDKSGEIAEQLAKSVAFVRVFHKANGGLSSARNYGLDRVSPSVKFVSFVDSDDYVEANFLSTLYNDIEKNDADISMCLANRVFDDNGVGKVFDSGFNKDFVSDDIEWVLKHSSFSACNKLFSVNIFSKLRFNEGITYEDFALIPQVLFHSSMICYRHKVLYHYYINRDSITLSIKKTDKNIFVAQQILEKSELRSKPKILECLYIRRVILSMAWTMLQNDKDFEGAHQIKAHQKSKYPDILSNSILKELPVYKSIFVYLLVKMGVKPAYYYLQLYSAIRKVKNIF